MSETNSRSLLVVAGFVLLLMLAGCVGPFEEDPSLPEPDEAAERYESLESYRASFTQNITTDGETRQISGELIQRPGEQRYRTEIRGDVSQTSVSNGTTIWRYTPEENRVVRSRVRPETSQRNTRGIRRFVRAAQSDGETEFNPLGSLLPGGSNTREAPNSPVNISYGGTTEFLDREAHVIDVEGASLEERHYLDTEYFVPLGWRSNRTGEFDWQTSMQFESIEFNPPDIDDSRFEFTPPENATVESPLENTDIETFDSRDALKAATELDVPDPDVPEGLSLQQASIERFSADNESRTELALEYRSALVSLSVSTVDTAIETNESTDSDRVTVDGQEGSFTEIGRQGQVRWVCNGQTKSVIGAFSKERLVEIAASVGC